MNKIMNVRIFARKHARHSPFRTHPRNTTKCNLDANSHTHQFLTIYNLTNWPLHKYIFCFLSSSVVLGQTKCLLGVVSLVCRLRVTLARVMSELNQYTMDKQTTFLAFFTRLSV